MAKEKVSFEEFIATFNIWKLFLLLIASLILSFLITFFANFFGDLGKIFSTMLFNLLFVSVILVISFRQKVSLEKSLSIFCSKRKFFASGSLAVILVNLLFILAALLIILVSSIEKPFFADNKTQIFLDTSAATLVAIIVGLITAPLLEEIFFRGVIVGRVSRKWGIAWSIIISMIAFAVVHGAGFSAPLLGAIILAVFYLKTGSIILSVLLHALNNLLIIFFDVLNTIGLESKLNGFVASNVNIATATVLVILTFLCGYFLIRILKTNWPQSDEHIWADKAELTIKK